MIRQIRDVLQANLAAGRPTFSIEFFPPKTEEGDARLFSETLPAVEGCGLDYCSVTYGAGGSTREKTLGIVERIQREFDLTTMMHLTCVNATREELAAVIAEAKARGVKNILALRGDPPSGTGDFQKTPGGFEFSRELVAHLRADGAFSIATAGFPEGHIAQKGGKRVDWDFLAEKVQAGADFVVTQLFFNNDDYFQMRDHVHRKLGRPVPILAGLLPVLSRNQTKRFTALCGAALPAPFVAKLDALGDDDAAVTAFGIEYCTEQVRALLAGGAPGVHFYSLNKAHSTIQILRNLGRA